MKPKEVNFPMQTVRRLFLRVSILFTLESADEMFDVQKGLSSMLTALRTFAVVLKVILNKLIVFDDVFVLASVHYNAI